MSLSLKEELVLIRTYIWRKKRNESRLRRKLASIESKIEQSRNQLRHVLKFMKQHQNGIDIHLKKLSKTEHTLREQIDNIFHEEIPDHNSTVSDTGDTGDTDNKTKQTKRAKILNNDLIEIVQHRNDHESRRDSSQSTFKLISSLLNDETAPMHPHNNSDFVLELDDNISKSISEYVYYRQQISKLQSELVECVEKRELANHSQYKVHKLLNKYMMNNRCRCGHCECKHKDEILIHDGAYSDDDDDDDDDDYDNNKQMLKNELIKLGQDIHQRSGLIRQQSRDGVCHLRVFVGSELITWMIKSDIVKTRYEASILASLLIDNGYVYCVHKSHHIHEHTSKKYKLHKNIKILNKKPSISLKPIGSSLSTLTKTQKAKTPNKLLSSTNTSSSSSSSDRERERERESAASSVLSITSSISTVSSCSFVSGSSSSWSGPQSQSQSQSQSPGPAPSPSPSPCGCRCSYCIESNKANNVSFHDNNDLYRFRVDDSRIERISKMGFLDKFGRFRCKRRHYIWDGVRRQLREYKSKGDPVPLYKYSFTQHTQICAVNSDACVLSIIMSPHNILKLKAANARERDSWIRVFMINNDNTNYEEAVDTNYEEYRHLRMMNRLKWSSLIKSVQPTSTPIQMFRECVLKSHTGTDIEREMNKLFTSRDSPIYQLFASFNRLFLEPFDNINTDELALNSVNIIITLCVDDLSSFLEIAQNRLINLLIPVSLRSRMDHDNPIIKLLYKRIKPCIYSLCFSSSVYNTVFALYRRLHHDIDHRLYHIAMSVYSLSTKEYDIADELQIDANKKISPFQSCFDKMTQLSHRKSPAQKLQCLVQLQQQIIKCIDNYRHIHVSVSVSVSVSDAEDAVADTDHKEEPQRMMNIRTHGIMSDDDDDTNMSLISYESTQSEYWTPLDTKNCKNRKCKQLLIASDDMIPLFCFVLVKSQIRHVHAEIAFMNDFMSDDEKQMKAGFYLTTLQAATSALLDGKLPVKT